MGCSSSKNVVSVTPVLDSSGILRDSRGSEAVSEKSLRGKSRENEEVEKEKIKETKETVKVVVESPKLVTARLGNFHKDTEGEQVAAGWPRWLTAVAAKAIHGWVPLKAENFEKWDKIGQGTYSTVFRAKNLETGKIVALKKVKFDNFDTESVKFMVREIEILRRLDHPNIMKLEGLITSRLSCSLYLVFEYMEHDLSGLSSSPDVEFTERQVKCYMKQLLSGLEHCHSRGIIHRDIKGANLLVNNEGILKIADFGLANFAPPENKDPLTSRVVTLWYRPPELLLGSIDYGAYVDMWSVGCVFAEMFLKKPILQGRTEVEQLHKIFKLCGSPSDEYWKNSKLPHEIIFKPHRPYEGHLHETFRNLPHSVYKLLEVLLSIDPQRRGTAESALSSEYFSTPPLSCEPSSLPKYPPTKEIDMKSDEDINRKIPKGNAKVRVTEATRKPTKVHRDPQEPIALRRPSNRQEPEPQKKNSGTDNSRDKLTGPRVNSNSRLIVDLQPMAALNPSDRGRHTRHASQGSGVPFSGPLRANNHSNGSKGDRKLHENRSFVKSHSKYTSRNNSHPPPEPAAATIRNRVSSRFDVQGNARPSHDRLDHDRQNEQYKLAKKAMLKSLTQLEHPDSFDSSKFHSHDFSRKGTMQSKRSMLGYHDERERVDFSGPLLSKSQKVDELLEKHERQIRKAVRKSWFQKVAGRKQVK
ncbi:probable serine/threonine-protein kinase At1g54610 isoform X1 [Phalaenopsis equestris]|uniref:probable serine/threonine-protein kinase At1g54610 isoform X1 n=1 Tax=Phalaenopsis equestris TaxID=78828 RepID=UPI0009E491C8|nr:probable serine/threonine-protein kinase At1g54610 isoform X1 [Phalaenopsis equestris]